MRLFGGTHRQGYGNLEQQQRLPLCYSVSNGNILDCHSYFVFYLHYYSFIIPSATTSVPIAACASSQTSASSAASASPETTARRQIVFYERHQGVTTKRARDNGTPHMVYIDHRHHHDKLYKRITSQARSTQGITYEIGGFTLIACSDASWGNNPASGKSISSRPSKLEGTRG